jgi:hypothetical protein
MPMPYLPEPGDDPGGGGTGGGGSSFGAATTIFQATFNKTEAASALRVIAYASVQSPDDLQFFAYLFIDGTLTQVATANIILDTQASRGAMPITLPAFVTGLAAGQHTITFSIRNREPAGALTVLAGSTMEIAELKQAAV